MSLCIIFCNNYRKNRRLYLSYKALELTCAAIHLIGFYCLFVVLDKRFYLIGYNYWTNNDFIENIFEDSVLCRAPEWNEDKITGTRCDCSLPLQSSFKFALIFLWHLYLIGAIIHAANFVLKIGIILTSNEKR